MRRSKAPSAKRARTTTTTLYRSPRQAFRVPGWSGRTNTGFPKELRMKHRYVTTATLNSTAGSFTTLQFRCNGMFDPDHSGIGHQPLYFDTLTGLYNHFTVLNSKIAVKCVSFGNTTVPMHVAMYVNDDTTLTPGTFYERAEQSSSRYGLVQPNGGNILVLRHNWSAKENFGPGALSDPNLQGNAAGDPTEQQLWAITGQVADLSGSGSCIIHVSIEYDAIWQELKDVSGS